MLGKASEIKIKQIIKTPVFSFNIEDHQKAKTLKQMLDEWLKDHPDYQIQSIAFSYFDRNEIANIIYKEASA